MPAPSCAFLQPLDEDDPDLELHRSLQAEFVGVAPTLPEEQVDAAIDPFLPWSPAEPATTAPGDPFAPLERAAAWEAL